MNDSETDFKGPKGGPAPDNRSSRGSDIVVFETDFRDEKWLGKLQFWKPEGLFAAWRLERDSGLEVSGNYGVFDYESSKIWLGRRPFSVHGEDVSYFSIDIQDNLLEKIDDRRRSMVTWYQSPSAGMDSKEFMKADLNLAPDEAVAGDCMSFKVNAWNIQKEKFYVQPWRFEDSAAIYMAWKVKDRIGMYGSYEKQTIWVDMETCYFTHFQNDKLEAEIKSEIEKLQKGFDRSIEAYKK